MTTGEDIRSARQRAGFTQEELAQRVGVSLRTVGNWERGANVPRSKLHVVEAVLGDYLTARTGEPALSSASDAELVAEIARRFARTAQEARHDRQVTESGQEAGSAEHSSENRGEDGSTTGRRTSSMSELEQRRQQRRQDEIDSLNFGTPNKPGDLDQGKLQPPPARTKSVAYEPDAELEGPAEARKSRERGEESQDED